MAAPLPLPPLNLNAASGAGAEGDSPFFGGGTFIGDVQAGGSALAVLGLAAVAGVVLLMLRRRK